MTFKVFERKKRREEIIHLELGKMSRSGPTTLLGVENVKKKFVL